MSSADTQTERGLLHAHRDAQAQAFWDLLERHVDARPAGQRAATAGARRDAEGPDGRPPS